MRIGIIGAMDEEIKVLKESMDHTKTWQRGSVIFMAGNFGKHELIVVRSGIGKVMAAITTAMLIDHYDVNMVINTGSAGGIGKHLKVGDIVIAAQTAYFDVDVTGFGYEMGQLPAMPLYYDASRYLVDQAVQAAASTGLSVHKGLIVTGDTFVNDEEKIKEIKEIFPQALAVEMEGAAVAQAALQFKMPYLVIRSLSDVGDEDAAEHFDQFIITAGQKSAEMVLTLIRRLP
ncbi:5'-methylthioadenosine/adenosylhomocysteine nucleosidase [Enterococcus hirae]|nr:5'-methylthioadenosine/adenosylhomocysteine nucleosidase [Enterococcaceae bacterium]MCI1919979.1 5'-methylthioadenosine/adenosylhomocysteine nucleosidase [Enterococcaceae bacterium]MDM8214370.1 5'-methylthioadenosine/adenosylhomocysteine nucleosidase [Enterococcus hirae]